jgi:nucleoside-diphosphate-sugar epimerase
MKKKIIIAGSTGMVGSLVLKGCVENPDVAHIINLVRKPLVQSTPKTTEIIVKDFSDYSSLADAFKGIDAAFFCIGAYTGSVPDDKFKRITVDFAVAFAQVLKQNSPDAILCLLSGAGAIRTGKSKISFAKYKGIAEAKISEMKLGRFFTFRPGYIYPVTKCKEPNLGYAIIRFLYPVIKLIASQFSVKSTELADAMVKAGIYGTPKEILENTNILMLSKDSCCSLRA